MGKGKEKMQYSDSDSSEGCEELDKDEFQIRYRKEKRPSKRNQKWGKRH